MKQLMIIGKVLFVILLVTAASLTGVFAKAFDLVSLVFVMIGTFAMTLMSFPFSEIGTAIRHASGDSGENGELRKSIYLWEAIARNAITIGVLATIIGLVLILSNMDDPAQLGPAISIAFLTVVYGVILGVVCAVPAMLLHQRLKDNTEETPNPVTSNTKAISIETIIGYLLFIGIVIFGIGGLKSFKMFIAWPPMVIVIGGAIALLLFLGRTGMGRAITLSFAFTGLIGALIGLAQLLSHLNDPKGLGPATAFIILSCFYAQLGMILTGFPLEDSSVKNETKPQNININRIAWYAFPLTSLIFVTLSIAMLIFIFSNLILK
ncbi:MAG: hypothetical protein GY765_30215 [bacterium]|nr:hypothetical protein [bacterium]